MQVILFQLGKKKGFLRMSKLFPDDVAIWKALVVSECTRVGDVLRAGFMEATMDNKQLPVFTPYVHATDLNPDHPLTKAIFQLEKINKKRMRHNKCDWHSSIDWEPVSTTLNKDPLS